MKQSWAFTSNKGNHDQKKAYPGAEEWASQEVTMY